MRFWGIALTTVQIALGFTSCNFPVAMQCNPSHVIAYTERFEMFVIFLVYSGSFLFFHQAPQVEKESGAEGEEDIGDSQEQFWTIL